MDKYMYDIVHTLAESGNDDAMWRIINDIMSTGRYTVTDEQSRIVLQYLNKLIEKDDQGAIMRLGTLYYTGMGYIPHDYIKAAELYQKAAEMSKFKNSAATNNLGYCYYYGRTGKADYEKAFYYFSLAAMHYNSNAMYKLGDFYRYGNHVKKDLDAAFYWYTTAKKYCRNYDDEDEEIDNIFDQEPQENYQEYISASIAMRMGIPIF